MSASQDDVLVSKMPSGCLVSKRSIKELVDVAAQRDRVDHACEQEVVGEEYAENPNAQRRKRQRAARRCVGSVFGLGSSWVVPSDDATVAS